MYQFIKIINDARKKFQIWNQPQVERYADSEIFAYSRGKFLVLLTNKVGGTVQKLITYHPFNAGDIICNIFYPSTDCITVQGNGFNIYLLNGEVKIYAPR